MYNFLLQTGIEQGKVFIGTISCAGGLAYYASPLSTLVEVLKTRDSSSLYVPVICANLCNATSWVVYGYLSTHDVLVWGPNVVGAILSVIQLLIAAAFHKGCPCSKSSSSSNDINNDSNNDRSSNDRSNGDSTSGNNSEKSSDTQIETNSPTGNVRNGYSKLKTAGSSEKGVDVHNVLLEERIIQNRKFSV